VSDSSERAVTVIIVTYRTAALTIACLKSLVPERATPGISLRAVVVDNASGDAPSIGAALDRERWGSWVKLIEAPKNGGFAYGNNLGFAHACADRPPDYLHMLNPDTVVRPGAIRFLVEFLENHPDVGIAGSRFENADGSDWPIAFRFPSLLSELETGLKLGVVSRVLKPWAIARIMGSEAQQVDWGAGASMMVRRAVLDQIGGLDENYFLFFEETEFCWRAKRAGYSMWYVPKSRVMHIAGQSTKVDERNAPPKRLPDYWFESRRRYFLTTRGIVGTLAIDLTAIVANALGLLKLVLQGRRDRAVPHYVADLCRYSVLHRKNRALRPIRAQLHQTLQ
jgi:N-acetylglucosaminyl-diphospho-decaprenol L-rhamnosyltransferase